MLGTFFFFKLLWKNRINPLLNFGSLKDKKNEDDTLDMTVWFQLIAAPLISSNTRDQVISWKYDEI